MSWPCVPRIALFALCLASSIVAGCAEPAGPAPRDVGPVFDGPRSDVGDTGPRADVVTLDVPREDSGRGDAAQCQACTMDTDCLSAHFCATLSSGDTVCLRACDIDLADCGTGFTCVANFTDDIPDPVCAPVGSTCCVDGDGDLYGSGVGCLGVDCDETATDVHSGADETCDGRNEDCDGTTDEGDPAMLCITGTHVATTTCDSGACSIGTCEPNFGDCNGDADDGCEANLLETTTCGTCGGACNLPNVDVHVCGVAGCDIGTCAPGWGDCDGLPMNGCEQSLTTASHCAACGVVCGVPNATSTCATGTCRIESCNPRWGDCDGNATSGCETPLVTETDCGTCGAVCAPAGGTGSCATGTCRVTTCMSGTEDCNMSTADGCETNIRTLTNCGACGVPCAFPNATASCAVGACTLFECLPTFGNCDGLTSNGCERTLNTTTNCGACGVSCAPANGAGSCSTGACEIMACNTGFADCDGLVSNGCETSLRTVTDCGACGTTCSRAGASATCATGTCSIAACSPGLGNCDGTDGNGCETPLSSTANCGGCGVMCSRPNAMSTCPGGTCGILGCNAGFANCDGVDPNGCETSLSSLASCGGCGVMCTRANAASTCSTGSCRIDFCNAGYANCDGIDANGCETSLSTLTNCGACGTTCNLMNAGESCASGVCQITSCSSGFDDCDSNDANGCEVSLRTTTDCAACGVPCSRANATATCATGACAISSCNPGSGNCDGSDPNGCEAPLTTLSNCSACGVACALDNAAESCATGSCAITTCSSGFGNCDGTTSNGCETSLTTLTNCATCGTACALANASESCTSGTCSIVSCSSGFEDCNGNDADGCERNIRTATDCGGCGVPCSRTNAMSSCATGVCGITGCNTGFGNCDGIDGNGCEASLTTLTSCGTCGTACDLPNATESCSTGTCTLGTCAAGFGNCNGVAADGCETALNSASNCGGCGTLCPPSGMPGSWSCATGTCSLSSCGAGTADCDGMSGNGCETAINMLTNCGGCGVACNLANATESCSTGTCAITMCSAGFGNCDGLQSNGCEAPLTSVTNCGGCGVACALNNASESCSTGTCAITMCNSGFGNCNGSTTDGCETPLNTPTNCAACGTTCDLANASESCASGSCAVTTCNSGFGNCDGLPANGCEVNTNTSLANCGSCGANCAPANAVPVCTAGSCGIGSCMPGWGNCNGLVSDGCETPLNTTSNCNACGAICDFPGASESCPGGTCTFGACSAGFGNCNGSTVDGCETSLSTLTNCGACGVGCNLANAAETCPSGACTLGACDPLFGNCDGLPANGCETSLQSLTSCGVCGTSCSRPNATPTCTGGTCNISTCNSGFGNCDGNGVNGCETNLTNTTTACGTCGTNCAASPPANVTGTFCSSSACGIASCSANTYNTDGAFLNGCECTADPFGNNCGAGTALGTLVDGATALTRSGNLVPAGDEDWFSFTVVSNGCSYLPVVSLMNGGLPIAMNVYTSCAGTSAGGPLSCIEGGTSAPFAGITTWEFTNSAACGDMQSIDPTPDYTGIYFQYTTIYVRVFATASSLSCLPFTISVTG